MALDFNGTTGYAAYTGSLVPAYTPVSVACWFRPDADTSGTLIGISSSSSAGNRLRLDIETTSNQIRAVSTNSANVTAAATSAAAVWASGTWTHAGAVFASSTSRTAYSNGTASTTDPTSNAATGTPDLVTFGAAVSSGGPFSYFNGAIAWAGIWNVALSGPEMTALAQGAHPLLIRPSALINAYDFTGLGTEIGRMGYGLTLNGTTAFSDSPRIYIPRGRSMVAIGVSGPLTSGTASGSGTSSTTASVSVTTASGGTPPYTYQWYRDTTPGFVASGANDVVGATSTTLNDTGLLPSTAYYYKAITTDNIAATVTSNEVALSTSASATQRNRIILVL